HRDGDHRALPCRCTRIWCRETVAALILDDPLRAQQAAADCFCALGADGLSAQGTTSALVAHRNHGVAGMCSVAAMGGRRVSRDRSLATSIGGISSARAL